MRGVHSAGGNSTRRGVSRKIQTLAFAREPPGLLRSITRDQGTEMARHLTITSSLGAPIRRCGDVDWNPHRHQGVGPTRR